ncbi:MAG: M23 family metallopeptidase [Candidatus Nanopelagicaceae bacterium]
MKRLTSLLLALTVALVTTPSGAVEVTYTFPIQESSGCQVTFSRYHHDYPAADLFTKSGCPFLSPVDGVVDEVSRTDTWSGRENLGETRGGKFVSIIGDDGVRYYGSHLRSVKKGIKVGTAVTSGQPLGTIGTSGSARGTPPHLHFGISWPTSEAAWWVRRGMVSPYDFLVAWQKGEMKSPKRRVARMLERVGEIPKEPKK